MEKKLQEVADLVTANTIYTTKEVLTSEETAKFLACLSRASTNGLWRGKFRTTNRLRENSVSSTAAKLKRGRWSAEWRQMRS